MMNPKKRRRITMVIAIILAVALVVPLLLQLVMADTGGENAADSGDAAQLHSSASTEGTDTSGTCAEGVFLEDINLSGMTRAQVQEAYDRKLADLSDDEIILYMGDTSTAITAGELGLTCGNPEVIDLAMIVGRKGNVLRRFRADQYLAENGSIVLPLDLSFDEKTIRMALTGKQDAVNTEPVPVTMVLNDDQTITAVDKVDGLKMQVEESAEKIRTYMEQDWHGGLGGAELVSKVVPATGNIDELANVRDLIGQGSTSYSGSSDERIHNIHLAAEAINGTILYPGEEFDFNQVVGETSEENGYELAGAYENGEIVESYGGGICQVSTTLYRAVLDAELEVSERYPHSMTVTYVQPSFDAAIADDVKNFCFLNSTDTPLYIHGAAGDGYVSFEIYGKETRDPARTIEFESRTISSSEYTTQFVYDNELEAGTITSTGGRDGLDTEAWKLIYQNGEKIDEVQINSSEYSMSPLTYHIGTIGATDSWLAEVDAAISTGDIEEVKAAVG